MRKMTLLAAFAAVAGASAAFAQQSTSAPPSRTGVRGDRGPGGRGGPGGLDRQLLKGITLTDAQKTKLAEVQKAEHAKMQAGRGPGRGDFDAIRQARQKGDTATANRLMADQRTKMEARRAEQEAAIRGILTGDQLAKFDANVAQVKQREAKYGQGRESRGKGKANGNGVSGGTGVRLH